MAKTVNEVMTHDPRTVEATANLVDVAKEMRDGDVGAILVDDDGRLKGIVTDRDIVVRAIAGGKDPYSTPVGSLCTGDPVTVSPDQAVEDVIQLMRDRNVRRVPVVQGGKAVGIISIGDLAMERDEHSALADISAAAPNN